MGGWETEGQRHELPSMGAMGSRPRARCALPQAQEKQRLVEQLSGLNAAHAEEVQRLRAEMRRGDAARDAQVRQLRERLAQLERHSARSCPQQEAEELRQVGLSVRGMLWLCRGSPGLGRDLAARGASRRGEVPAARAGPSGAPAAPAPPLPAALGTGGSCEAAAGRGAGCPGPACPGAGTGPGR